MGLRRNQEKPPIAENDGTIIDPVIVTDLPPGLEHALQGNKGGIYDTTGPQQTAKITPPAAKPPREQPQTLASEPQRTYVPPAAAPPAQPKHAAPTSSSFLNFAPGTAPTQLPQAAHTRPVRPALPASSNIAPAAPTSSQDITPPPPPSGSYGTLIGGFEGDNGVEPRRGHGRLIGSLAVTAAALVVIAAGVAHSREKGPEPDSTARIIVTTSSPEPSTGLITTGDNKDLKGLKAAKSGTKGSTKKPGHATASPSPEPVSPSPEHSQPAPQETPSPTDVPVVPPPPIIETPTPMPTEEVTPTPTPTPTEEATPTPTPELALQPEDAAMEALTTSIDYTKMQELHSQNPSLEGDVNTAKQSLSQMINSYDIRAAQTAAVQLYGNPDVAAELGEQVSMNTSMLQSMQGQSRQVSFLVVGNSNQIFTHMQYNFPLAGIAPLNLAMIPNTSDLYRSIQQSIQDSVDHGGVTNFPSATDTALIGVERIDTADHNGTMSIAVTWGTYPVQGAPDQPVVSIYVLVPTGPNFVGMLAANVNIVNPDSSTPQPSALDAIKKYFEQQRKHNSDTQHSGDNKKNKGH